MPGMDGIELLEAIREDRPDPPFILFTGRESEETAARAIETGVDGYQQKRLGRDQHADPGNHIRNSVAKYLESVRADRFREEYVLAAETASDAFWVCDPSTGAMRVNYPDLPRSGLLGPRLLRSGLPVSVSELASDVDTAVPDSAGDFPSRAVRSVPLLPIRHSATTDDARFLSRLNNAGGVASILLPPSTAGVVRMPIHTKTNDGGAVSPPYCVPCPLARTAVLVEVGA